MYPDDPPLILQGQPHCSDDIHKNGMCWDSASPNPGKQGGVCMCPAPMHFVNVPGDSAAFTCACPAGTKPQKVGLTSVCLCSDNLPVGADGKCPQKCDCKCPNNQVAQSQGYKQANGSCSCNCGCSADLQLNGDHCDQPACAGDGQVRIADGSCCAASKVSSCGVCCKANQKPGVNGSCVSASLPDDSKSLLQKYFPKAYKPRT